MRRAWRREKLHGRSEPNSHRATTDAARYSAAESRGAGRRNPGSGRDSVHAESERRRASQPELSLALVVFKARNSSPRRPAPARQRIEITCCGAWATGRGTQRLRVHGADVDSPPSQQSLSAKEVQRLALLIELISAAHWHNTQPRMKLETRNREAIP